MCHVKSSSGIRFLTRSRTPVFQASSLVMLSYSDKTLVNFSTSPSSQASARSCSSQPVCQDPMSNKDKLWPKRQQRPLAVTLCCQGLGAATRLVKMLGIE